ncbi:hypothetical protein [Vibrio phage VP16T]|nr:hypothetical protein [Vibrio phage VP16T]
MSKPLAEIDWLKLGSTDEYHDLKTGLVVCVRGIYFSTPATDPVSILTKFFKDHGYALQDHSAIDSPEFISEKLRRVCEDLARSGSIPEVCMNDILVTLLHHGVQVHALPPEPASTTPTPAPKIVSVQVAPNDAHWQGALIGLDDQGTTYIVERINGSNKWVEYVPALKPETNDNV